jgi:hypothetical protein
MEGAWMVEDEPDRQPDEEWAGRTETPSAPETEWAALSGSIMARYGTVIEKLAD